MRVMYQAFIFFKPQTSCRTCPRGVSGRYRQCVRRVSRVGAHLCWATRARTRWTSRCTCWTPARTASSWCFLRPCGASSCSSPGSCPSAPWGSAAAPRAPAGERRPGRPISQSVSGLCMQAQKFPGVPFTCYWVCSQQTMQTSHGRGVAPLAKKTLAYPSLPLRLELCFLDLLQDNVTETPALRRVPPIWKWRTGATGGKLKGERKPPKTPAGVFTE